MTWRLLDRTRSAGGERTGREGIVEFRYGKELPLRLGVAGQERQVSDWRVAEEIGIAGMECFVAELLGSCQSVLEVHSMSRICRRSMVWLGELRNG